MLIVSYKLMKKYYKLMLQDRMLPVINSKVRILQAFSEAFNLQNE